jgi:hypothetical protein
METTLFVLGSLIFLGALSLSLVRVFSTGGRVEAVSRPLVATESERMPELAAAPVAFRAVGGRGECPLGRREGDVVVVDAAGSITPEVCVAAQTVLRLAATAEDQREVKEWCCPIFDHQLVFQRVAPRQELKAA